MRSVRRSLHTASKSFWRRPPFGPLTYLESHSDAFLDALDLRLPFHVDEERREREEDDRQRANHVDDHQDLLEEQAVVEALSGLVLVAIVERPSGVRRWWRKLLVFAEEVEIGITSDFIVEVTLLNVAPVFGVCLKCDRVFRVDFGARSVFPGSNGILRC